MPRLWPSLRGKETPPDRGEGHEEERWAGAREESHTRQALLRELQRRFAEHNRSVLVLAGLTFLAAAALWYIAYAVLYWLTLLAASARHGVDARAPETLPALFIYAAALLVFITWLAGRWSPDERPRDKKPALVIAAEFLLAIPRATLAVWGNLSAYQRLDFEELEAAADLMERLAGGERLPIHALPLVLPAAASREKIVLALQLVQLIELRRSDGEAWLRLATRGTGMLAG